MEYINIITIIYNWVDESNTLTINSLNIDYFSHILFQIKSEWGQVQKRSNWGVLRRVNDQCITCTDL